MAGRSVRYNPFVLPLYIFSSSNFDGLVKSQKTSFFVIPAPHQVRDKLQPVEDSDLSENPVFSASYRVSGLRFSPE